MLKITIFNNGVFHFGGIPGPLSPPPPINTPLILIIINNNKITKFIKKELSKKKTF
jgi:hypothetical protein